MTSTVKQLAAHGQSVWLDTLSRPLLDSGELAVLVETDGVCGVTSNPTIFQKALADSDAYDDQLRALLHASPRASDKELFLALSGEDITRACAVLHDRWRESGGVDGYASWEVDPALADDHGAMLEEAHDLVRRVNAPNLYVKIPATDAGVGAIEDAVAAGLKINVTLIFSLERHAQVMEAYLRGLERRLEAGAQINEVHSVASFFVSRVDIEADKRLASLGRADLKGQLGVANAKLAYQRYLRVFRGPRWTRLAEQGAHAQRCLWASTSMKDPAARDVHYVEQLIGKHTVNTMPKETLAAFRDHGIVAETLERDVDAARATFEAIKRAGIDYDDVCRTLEQEGIKKFVDSFDELTRQLRAKRSALTIDTSTRALP